MADDKKYNGWTNYETWVVKLWIDNDEGMQNYWQSRAQEAFDRASDGDSYKSQTRKESAACTLTELLKDEHEDAKDELLVAYSGKACNVFHDLLNAAMSEVNWYEIAEDMLEDIEVEA